MGYNRGLATPMWHFARLVAGAVSGLALTGQIVARQPDRAAPAREPSQAAVAERRALLIGVTDFQNPRLKARGLKGPANDVELFRQILTRTPLSVPAANITILSGDRTDPALRPTRANIEREFARMAQVSKKGDQIAILMAGHGSQQPADADPADEEPDGLDEIFLPADVAGWDGKIGRVRNAIVDDEIRTWVDGIRNTGAFVWLIFDACHSGTMARGLEVERQIPMSDLIPAEAIEATRRHSNLRGATATNVIGLPDSAGDVAALYAAHMAETTPEKPLPNADSPIHGLFSYTIADILSQSSGALTYRELALRVLQHYRSMPRYSPTPLFEGGGLDREVLGQRMWPERPQILLGERTAAGPWALRAGSVHGLTVGSTLELFPPAGTAAGDTRIGYVKVVAVEATSARVVPVAYDGVAAPQASRLAVGSRARVTYFEFGDLRLKVGFEPLPAPTRIERVLSTLSESTNGLAYRVGSAPVDWFVRLVDGRVVLAPADHSQTDGRNQFLVSRVDDPNMPALLSSALKKIARAKNLMRLASASGAGPHLDLRVFRYATASADAGRPLFSTPGDVAIRAGEFVEFRVRNDGGRPIDLTVLYIDAAFGIQPLYPARDREVDNQVKPGEERVLGRFAVTDAPLGWESAVAIAVESSTVRQNFSTLAQDSLEVRRNSDATPPSPLRELLEQAMFGVQDRTRGVNVNPGPFVIKVVTWRTDKAVG